MRFILFRWDWLTGSGRSSVQSYERLPLGTERTGK